MDKNELIAVRDSTPSDKSFIMATWLRSLRFGNEWFRLIDATIYFSVYHKLIESILNKPTVKIKVACLKEDSEVILGYAVYENDNLHWVYVKKAWRAIGLAKNLAPEQVSCVTHLTAIGKSILSKHPKVIFNPFFT